MNVWRVFFAALLLSGAHSFTQTAEELVNKNIEARGGLAKINAVKTVRISGKAITPDGTPVIYRVDNKAPDLYRLDFTLAGMTAVQVYDGTTGWQIQPFGGRKDPMLMGEDDLRDLLSEPDFWGPLVDYKAKGNKVEYLGKDLVDGDDTLRLKVTLKNGDVVYCYLDPDTYLEIRREIQMFIRGSMKEKDIDFGSYKPVAGVMFPFSQTEVKKDDPTNWITLSVDKVEVNLPLDNSEFAVPASLSKK
jgi:outer membrane lipoprotein-sorting protein